MALTHGIGPEAVPDRTSARALGMFVLVVSLVGFFLALWTGGMVLALHDLLSAFGLTSRGPDAAPYPLGAWTLAIYAAGGVLGFFAGRYPLRAGLGLVPVLVLALVYGGPITRVYGILLLVAAAGLLTIALLERAGGARTAR